MVSLSLRQVKILKKLEIVAVYLFGSAVEKADIHNISDIDIGVLISHKKQKEENLNKTYLALYNLFSEVFLHKTLDIIFIHRVNLELKYDIISQGVILYENENFSEERIKFEDQTTMLYLDFEPILRECDNLVLRRI